MTFFRFHFIYVIHFLPLPVSHSLKSALQFRARCTRVLSVVTLMQLQSFILCFHVVKFSIIHRTIKIEFAYVDFNRHLLIDDNLLIVCA